jgi:predicted Zn-dependent peptidase
MPIRSRNIVSSSFINTRTASHSKTLYDENNYSKTVYDNGLTLISQNIQNLRSVSVGVWVLVGSRYENQDNMGICHFIEHSVFKGTKKRNALRIAKSLEDVGGSLNAFTSKEQTCFYANILSEDLPLALDVISDLVQNARFIEKEIDKEKQVIIEEIKDTEDTPEEFIQDYFYGQLFKKHPLGYGILGSRYTVSNFTRKEILHFYDTYYVPRNIIVSVAGNFNERELQRLVKQKFGFTKSGANRSYWPHGFKGFERSRARGRTEKIEKNISQAHVCIGSPLPISYLMNRKFDLLALNTILGGGMSSRLFQKIREKYGLAYTIYSFVDFMYDGGVFGVYMATDKNKLEKSIEVVKSEFTRLAVDGIKKQELQMAKAQIRANLLFGLESTSTRMIRLAKNEIYLKKKLNIADITNYIDKLSIEDIQKSAYLLFKDLDKMQVSVLS